jgi:hypothetical protein
MFAKFPVVPIMLRLIVVKLLFIAPSVALVTLNTNKETVSPASAVEGATS